LISFLLRVINVGEFSVHVEGFVFKKYDSVLVLVRSTMCFNFPLMSFWKNSSFYENV